MTASADGTGRVWDLASGRCMHVLAGHERSSSGVWAVALTPDARRAVTTGEDFTARVWDTLTGRCSAVLQGHSGWVVDVAITPDGAHAITASHDGTARCGPNPDKSDLSSGLCSHCNGPVVGSRGQLASTQDVGPLAVLWD